MYNFVIEDGYNTSYIDALFMGLFYTPSLIENIFLSNNPKVIDKIFLQEIIKDKFVDIIRNEKSVLIDTINEIRNILFMYGWLDYNTLCDHQNINDFYKFIADLFTTQIKIQKKNNKQNIVSIGEPDNLYSIDITLDKHTDDMISLKDTYDDWLNKSYNGDQNIINNIPYILPFYINRNNNKNKINIQKRIKLDPDDINNIVDLVFHSAICEKDNHYYTLLQNCGKWFIYDNKTVPCLTEVKMNNKDIIDMIMTDVVMIFYIYNQ